VGSYCANVSSVASSSALGLSQPRYLMCTGDYFPRRGGGGLINTLTARKIFGRDVDCSSPSDADVNVPLCRLGIVFY
jgi:hypothetical protein